MSIENKNTSPAEYTQAQIQVFGTERLNQTQGHEASKESSEALLNTITALCHEKGALTHHFIHHRKLQRPGIKQPIVLVTGTLDGQMGPGGFGNMDNALASVDYLQSEKKLKRRQNPTLFLHGIVEAKKFVREGVFVGTDGKAMVQREISRNRGKSSLRATKAATEEEVETAMAAIVDAVRHEDELGTKETSVK